VTEAEMLPTLDTKSGGGLLVAGLLVLAVGGGIYMLTRRPRAAA